MTDDIDGLLKTMRGDAQTLARSPSSTVAPPSDGELGRKALEALQRLTHDPRALEDEGPIGEGGMGVVHLARQVSLDRRVAIKFLRPDRGSTHDVEQLLSEAWTAGKLEHPNILPIHALALTADGKPVIVMKRIEGVTWSALLRDPGAMEAHAPGKVPLDEHLRILTQVCHAVHFAHTRGVVHRDLKPENVTGRSSRGSARCPSSLPSGPPRWRTRSAPRRRTSTSTIGTNGAPSATSCSASTRWCCGSSSAGCVVSSPATWRPR